MLFLFKCITAEEKGWLHDLISVQNDGRVKINDKKDNLKGKINL
jgi:hypothetical protein